MRTVKLQGRAQTLRDQHRVFATRKYSTADLDPSSFREFVGPPTPVHILISRLPVGWGTERHWRIADDFKRYGKVVESESGAPYVGDAFGYGQPTREV